MRNGNGSFCLVLHSHIPYVLDHGRSPHGSDWLCEAAAESYMPLLDVCHRLIAKGISPKLTIGLTPVLLEQLADIRFKQEMAGYLRRHIDQSSADERSFRGGGSQHLANVAAYWRDWYERALHDFESRLDRDLVGAFRRLQDDGHIELIAGSATHAYLPLLSEESAATQVRVGIETFRRHFGLSPRCFWLPECAYRPGLERLLAGHDIEYFFSESAEFRRSWQSWADGDARDGNLRSRSSAEAYGDRFDAIARVLAKAASRGTASGADFDHAAVHRLADADIAVFSRDPATGAQVWSAEVGYPGNERYLEFHKHHDGSVAGSLGLKYWRVTKGRPDLAHKEPYEPAQASSQAELDGTHFGKLVEASLAASDGAVVCSMYDTELFGHWWYEGPQFLYAAIAAIASNPLIRRQTCSEQLADQPPALPPIHLPAGSWGAGGDDRMWRNDQTAWVWDLIGNAEAQLCDAALGHADKPGIARILAQAQRELMLMSASDWPFCITTGAAADYAQLRVRNHHDNFTGLMAIVHRVADLGLPLRPGDLRNLIECEATNRVFSTSSLTV